MTSQTAPNNFARGAPWRVAALVTVVLLAVVGVYFGLQPHPESDDPTSATTRASLTWVTREGSTVEYAIDTSTGWVRLTDDRYPDMRVYARAGQLYFQSEASGEPGVWFATPVSYVLPAGVTLSAHEISLFLDRRPRECSFPSAAERLYSEHFLSDRISSFPHPFAICGSSGSSFDGGSIRALEQYLSDPFDVPELDDVVQLSTLGEAADGILFELRAAWSARYGTT